MIYQLILISSLLVYDVVPKIYPLDYDGYGYSHPLCYSPQALAEQLIEGTILEDCQMGMEVEQVTDTRDTIEVMTTGSKFIVSKRNGSISCYQLIGDSRELIRVNFAGIKFQDIACRGSGKGYVLLGADDFAFRFNGDGLLMVRTTKDLRIEIDILHEFDYVGNNIPSENKMGCSYLFLDGYGGFGVYLIEDEERELTPHKLSFELDVGKVFWVAVFPPREYRQETARDRLIFYKGQPEVEFYPVYPTTKEFDRWSGINVDSTSFRSEIDGRWGTNPEHIDYGEIVVLMSDVELWTSWHTEYVPRCGWDRFHETVEHAHGSNKKILFYVSPSQFYKCSRYFVFESRHYLGDSTRPVLIQDIAQIYEEGEYWPPGNPEGENMQEFLKAVKRMLNHRSSDGDHIPDGLYVDGLYFLNIPQSYILLRELRQLVGEDRTICLHSAPIPGGDAYLPTLEAYADYVLKGEGGRVHYDDQTYMKYFIRTHGISNAAGIFLNERDRDGNYILLREGELLERLLECRLQVRLESPLVDLASRWDGTHNWEKYRRDILHLWKMLSLNNRSD
jgi:hypothetical protein